MDTQPASFAKKIFNNTTFAIFDQISYKIGTTVAFILLVRLLSDSAIAAIGIASGYMIAIGYLDLGLVRILLRDYPKIAADREERNLHFSAYLIFLLIQGAAMALVSVALQLLLLDRLGIPGLTFLYWGLTVEFFALVVQDWIKMVFFTDLQQGFATRVSVVLMVVRLSSYAVLLFSPTLETFVWILILISLLSILVWSVVFVIRFNFRPRWSPRLVSITRHALTDYGIWDHFNRMTFDTLFNVDTAILILFIKAETVLSQYSVAIKVISLMLLIPRQITRSLQLVLANYKEDQERYNAIHTFMKANALVSVAQFIFVIFFGRQLIFVLFGDNVDIGGVYQYMVILMIGLTILMIGFPLISVINNFTRLRESFFKVFLPSMLIGLAIYFVAAWQWGALGMAYANIFGYSILVIAMFLFIQRQYPIPLRFKLITREEKRLLQELLRGFH
jgi:O-antigen/teichoic acid export membrane protein